MNLLFSKSHSYSSIPLLLILGNFDQFCSNYWKCLPELLNLIIQLIYQQQIFFMSSVRWSELNDDSSSNSSMSSQVEDHCIQHSQTNIDHLNNLQPTLNLKKTESLPPETTTKRVRESKKNEDLEKLKEHDDHKVWLYVLDSSKNDKTIVVDVLKNHEDIEKVYEMKVGWNVLMKTELASEYISRGIRQKGVWVKLIYSKKNTQRQNKLKAKPQKLPKRPKRDFMSPSLKVNEKNKTNKPKKVSNRKQADINQGDRPQKKTKYVAADKKSEQVAKLESIQQDKQCPSHDQNLVTNEQKSETISTPELQEASNNNQQLEFILQKIDKPLFEIQMNPEQQDTDQKVDKEQLDQVNSQVQSDSSEQLKRQKKLMEKKKSKKKKKGKNGIQHKDNNNPFSALCS